METLGLNQLKLMQNQKLHPVMLAGTGSDVGKSVLAAALCRIFLQDGYHPAPFKAQNMALNSYATPQGLEIGRAQAVQAEAAGVPCHTDMNPLLLKPWVKASKPFVLKSVPLTTGWHPVTIRLCLKEPAAFPRSIFVIRTWSIFRWPAMPVPMYSWWPTLTVAAYLPVHTVPLFFRPRKTGSASRE